MIEDAKKRIGQTWIEENSEQFIQSVREKILMLVAEHGPIVDIIHNRDSYDAIEAIINFLIKHFLVIGEVNK